MSYEVIQSVGKYQYIYLAEGYRNENGDSRQKRRSIGKIHPKTGEKVYKPEYLEELRLAGVPIEISSTDKQFSVEDIRKSSVRSYGLFHLFCGLSERIGLIDALQDSIPDYWKEIFMLSVYMVSSGDPLMYCSDWLENVESYSVGSLTSQRISELLIALTPEQREKFFQLWYARNEEDEYLALDITSESSYSDLIEDVEWGYNRERKSLPQINLCMLMGESSRLPLYQSVYSGSIKDVRTLETTLTRLEATTGKRSFTIVMDKGFFSARNINFLLGDEQQAPINFIIAVPFTSSFAKKQVESERKDIDCLENTIVVNNYPMRAVTKKRSWSKGNTINVHVYYSAKKANGIREDLYAKVAILKKNAIADPEKYLKSDECRKYLAIRKSEKREEGYTVNIRKDIVDKELSTAGWTVLISNHVACAERAIGIYRDKDVVEKGFLRLKNNIDLGRLRVHSDNTMQGKLFIGFIASVIMSEMNRVMVEKGLYKKYTMKSLLRTIEKLRVQDINGQDIVYPATKAQRTIYDAFSVEAPIK